MKMRRNGWWLCLGLIAGFSSNAAARGVCPDGAYSITRYSQCQCADQDNVKVIDRKKRLAACSYKITVTVKTVENPELRKRSTGSDPTRHPDTQRQNTQGQNTQRQSTQQQDTRKPDPRPQEPRAPVARATDSIVLCPAGRFRNSGKRKGCICPGGTVKNLLNKFTNTYDCRAVANVGLPAPDVPPRGNNRSQQAPKASVQPEPLAQPRTTSPAGRRAPRSAQSCPRGKFKNRGKTKNCVCPQGSKKNSTNRFTGTYTCKSIAKVSTPAPRSPSGTSGSDSRSPSGTSDSDPRSPSRTSNIPSAYSQPIPPAPSRGQPKFRAPIAKPETKYCPPGRFKNSGATRGCVCPANTTKKSESRFRNVYSCQSKLVKVKSQPRLRTIESDKTRLREDALPRTNPPQTRPAPLLPAVVDCPVGNFSTGRYQNCRCPRGANWTVVNRRERVAVCLQPQSIVSKCPIGNFRNKDYLLNCRCSPEDKKIIVNRHRNVAACVRR